MKNMAIIDRFIEKVDCSNPNGCMIWTGSKSQRYGQFAPTQKSRTSAHRWSYTHYYNKEIPRGYEINHICRNKKCVNPSHLECLTLKDHKAKDLDLVIATSSKVGKVTGRVNCLKRRKNDMPEGVSKSGLRGLKVEIKVPGLGSCFLGSKPLDTPENRVELAQRYERVRHFVSRVRK